jgi:protein-S-isoprenylcysteine O-methyltransferase Ste14
MNKPEVARDGPRITSATKSTPVPVPDPSASSTRVSRLDLLERVIVLACYAYFFWNWITDFVAYPTWPRGLVIVSECVTLLVLLIRKPAHTFSGSVVDWLLALGATTTPALLAPGKRPIDPEWVGLTLLATGLCCQILCKLVLGRSFGLIAANRGVKQAGPYRLVRHPMYASYLITHFGVFWLNPTPRNVVVYLLCWGLQIPRILAEESHLSQDPGYVEYQKVVRYRLIPFVF